jgi:hypothetical protein
MSFTLENIVPWGRPFDEYVAMFGLSPEDLDRRILGCADGPAAFNAEMNVQGRHVVSVDPIYDFTEEEIRSRVTETFPVIMDQLYKNLDDYVWTYISSPEELGARRMAALETFLEDFPAGKEESRYVTGDLLQLPFRESRFDLVLCSHFLFLYSEQLSADFHCRAVDEMLRVADEVRLFPLLTLGGQEPAYLDNVCRHLNGLGRKIEIVKVDYEFQRGGDRMLRIW